MKRVQAAIEAGRCSIAVAGSLLRDADVMLELKRRAALTPMTLSGHAQSPVTTVGDAGLHRSVVEKGGALVLVEPGQEDQPGLQALARMLGEAKNKPTLFVVARSFNALQYRFAFRGINVTHIKARGKLFLRDLAIPEGEAVTLKVAASTKTKKARAGDGIAPRMHFAGREEELPALVEILGAPGPVVVSGPPGIGKTWLIEHAIIGTELARLPEFVIAAEAARMDCSRDSPK
jgi:hypothetical protein